MTWCMPNPQTGWRSTTWLCCVAGGAIESFTQLLDAHPDFTAARLQRVFSFRSSNDVHGVIADPRLVVEQKPDNAKARLHLGALLVAMGAVEAGEALLWG
jgi:thioredoxin-like negative regulator of GroEL